MDLWGYLFSLMPGIIPALLGTVIGWLLAQLSKPGEARRAQRERVATGVESRRRALVEKAYEAGHSFLSGRENGRSWHAHNIAVGIRKPALFTGESGDGQVGSAICDFLMNLERKVHGYTVDSREGLRRQVLFPPDQQSVLWEPYLDEFTDLGLQWINERKPGAWFAEKVTALADRMLLDRQELTGQGTGRTLDPEGLR